jgi:RND family efflux transporter MFP subunit
MKSIKSFLYLVPVAALLVGCAAEPEAEKEDKNERNDLIVSLETVEETQFEHKIRVQGNIETDQDVLLTAEMGGLITNVLVKEGQKVTKGQVIARVDASVLASNMAELQSQLKYAQYMLDKQTELHKRGVGSEFDLETAQNQVNAIKASMNSISTQQGKAVVRAPFSGVIDQVFATGGQMAGPAAPIARLVNNSNVDIVATISEKHYMQIKVGTPIEVSFPNYSDTVLHLAVTNVGNYIEPTNRTFRIMSSVKNNKMLLPNMLAEVSITDMKVDKGIVIPTKAILKDENNEDFVFVAEPSAKEEGCYTVKKVNIKVLEKYEGKALIKTGSSLKVNQQIVVEGARGISEESIVRTK